MQDFLENKPIFDYDVLERGYYFRDGFCFNRTYDKEINKGVAV